MSKAPWPTTVERRERNGMSVGCTTVEFDGVLFSIWEKRTMDCQYGHQYYKQRQVLNKQVHLQDTKKMGCKALIVQ